MKSAFIAAIFFAWACPGVVLAQVQDNDRYERAYNLIALEIRQLPLNGPAIGTILEIQTEDIDVPDFGENPSEQKRFLVRVLAGQEGRVLGRISEYYLLASLIAERAGNLRECRNSAAEAETRIEMLLASREALYQEIRGLLRTDDRDRARSKMTEIDQWNRQIYNGIANLGCVHGRNLEPLEPGDLMASGGL